MLQRDMHHRCAASRATAHGFGPTYPGGLSPVSGERDRNKRKGSHLRAQFVRTGAAGARVKLRQRPRFQRRNRRQRLAFQELEEGAASGRDVAHLVGDAEFVDGGDGVATAGDGERS